MTKFTFTTFKTTHKAMWCKHIMSKSLKERLKAI